MSREGNGKNVIWILADQLRADALSVNGDPNVSTPNIDNLALQGINFNRAVSGTPLCSPYRGALLTGCYPHKSSVAGHDFTLNPKRHTIAEVFNGAGYDTLYYGKWHLEGLNPRIGTGVDPQKQFVPRDHRGKFSTWVGYENNNSQFNCWVHGHDGEQEVPLHRLPGFETDSLVDMGLQKIRYYGEEKKEGRNRPFFMVISVQPPHDPYIAPARFMGKYNSRKLVMKDNVPPYGEFQKRARQELAGYYALIENLDWNVGRILNELRENGLDLDTHIIFFSDHGDMHGSHGMFRKTNPYEEAIRVPFIIGGEMPMTYYDSKSGVSDLPVNHVDAAPTTLGLCDLEIPEWMEGTDYSWVRSASRVPGEIPDSAYLQSVVPTRHYDSIDIPYRGIVTRDGWKYVCLENQEWLLFNLNDDPLELINLAHNSLYIDKRIELNRRLKEWARDTEDDFNVPDVPYLVRETPRQPLEGMEESI
ncbi:sulfatase-like hydrolase/transferase [Clostridium sp. MCC353]|uniref:sulfatase family protein n=1 Tax=Clostridium sp. MCC353 TaxID=2592646 RepID=UPI001C025AE5|nr:sulfatase [Clostridium sp. MCC353]MBT9776728.1 sulfatase-like hydrolase/transferase [Clostridium sp. MCC353]